MTGLLSATLAFEDIEVGADPTHSNLGLKVPMTPEEPGVAVAEAGAYCPTLVAVVAEMAEFIYYVACEGEVAEVEFAADCMYGEEMTRSGVAKPVSNLRLRHPVLPSAPVIEAPGVEVAGEVDAPFGRDAQFGP